jgi:molybdate transport system substrate-binding protein
MIRMTISSRLLLGLLLLLAGATAFAAGQPAPTPAPSITVFAAASMKESLDAVAADWTARSGQKVVVSYAASNALARQIEKDAPADVFISADQDWMDYLDSRGLVAKTTRFDLVGNRLVLIVPAASPVRRVNLARPRDFDGALGDGRLAIAESSVPAGKYGQEALVRLGLWERASKRLAPGENVRAALAFVAQGEAPLGIVYFTDARAEPKVRVVATFPSSSHSRIVYPVAALAKGNAAASAGFLAYLRSARARAVFVRAGFSAP